MAAEKLAKGGAEAETTTTSLLDQAIGATKQTTRSEAEDMIRALVEEVNKGTISVGKDVTRTIKSGIAAIDAVVSKQLAAVMHHPRFQKLEGTWRGLNYLV